MKSEKVSNRIRMNEIFSQILSQRLIRKIKIYSLSILPSFERLVKLCEDFRILLSSFGPKKMLFDDI